MSLRLQFDKYGSCTQKYRQFFFWLYAITSFGYVQHCFIFEHSTASHIGLCISPNYVCGNWPHAQAFPCIVFQHNMWEKSGRPGRSSDAVICGLRCGCVCLPIRPHIERGHCLTMSYYITRSTRPYRSFSYTSKTWGGLGSRLCGNLLGMNTACFIVFSGGKVT